MKRGEADEISAPVEAASGKCSLSLVQRAVLRNRALALKRIKQLLRAQFHEPQVRERLEELETLLPLVEEVRVIAAELKKSGQPVLHGEAMQKFVNCDLRFHMLLFQAGGNESEATGQRCRRSLQADGSCLASNECWSRSTTPR